MKAMLSPPCPARAVRPLRCTKTSAFRGGWKWSTAPTPGTSKPRAEMSVETNTAWSSLWNRSTRLSLSFCRMLECKPSTSTDMRDFFLTLSCCSSCVRPALESTLETFGLSMTRESTDVSRDTEEMALTKRMTRPPGAAWTSGASLPGMPASFRRCSQRYRRRSHMVTKASRSVSVPHVVSRNSKASGSRVFKSSSAEPPSRCVVPCVVL
mmetsp:Transcript_85934/g.199786  ORF Transcript_85934/g.199786 Transcript_85934/m.199786 type:complete len:210 (-) Transcript_85934:445-1074(-)